ncbi:hypothetical protein A7982_12163 [Minicystis rosea]|nr:hypothetical protein A7982_12163 [Minicystis rosea]
MKSFKSLGILSALLSISTVAVMAHAAPGAISAQRATIALDASQTVYGASMSFRCGDVVDYDGFLFGWDCEGVVTAADGSTVFSGSLPLVGLDPLTRIGGLAAPEPGSTAGKETCEGGQRECGPGSKFHGACDLANGGYSGSDPDPVYNIPQKWHCTLP